MKANADPVELAQSRVASHERLLGATRGSNCRVMQTPCLVAVVLALLACSPAKAQFLGGSAAEARTTPVVEREPTPVVNSVPRTNTAERAPTPVTYNTQAPVRTAATNVPRETSAPVRQPATAAASGVPVTTPARTSATTARPASQTSSNVPSGTRAPPSYTPVSTPAQTRPPPVNTPVSTPAQTRPLPVNTPVSTPAQTRPPPSNTPVSTPAQTRPPPSNTPVSTPAPIKGPPSSPLGISPQPDQGTRDAAASPIAARPRSPSLPSGSESSPDSKRESSASPYSTGPQNSAAKTPGASPVVSQNPSPATTPQESKASGSSGPSAQHQAASSPTTPAVGVGAVGSSSPAAPTFTQPKPDPAQNAAASPLTPQAVSASSPVSQRSPAVKSGATVAPEDASTKSGSSSPGPRGASPGATQNTFGAAATSPDMSSAAAANEDITRPPSLPSPTPATPGLPGAVTSQGSGVPSAAVTATAIGSRDLPSTGASTAASQPAAPLTPGQHLGAQNAQSDPNSGALPAASLQGSAAPKTGTSTAQLAAAAGAGAIGGAAAGAAVGTLASDRSTTAAEPVTPGQQLATKPAGSGAAPATGSITGSTTGQGTNVGANAAASKQVQRAAFNPVKAGLALSSGSTLNSLGQVVTVTPPKPAASLPSTLPPTVVPSSVPETRSSSILLATSNAGAEAKGRTQQAQQLVAQRMPSVQVDNVFLQNRGLYAAGYMSQGCVPLSSIDNPGTIYSDSGCNNVVSTGGPHFSILSPVANAPLLGFYNGYRNSPAVQSTLKGVAGPDPTQGIQQLRSMTLTGMQPVLGQVLGGTGSTPGYYLTDSDGLPQSSTVSSQSSAMLMAASEDMPAGSAGPAAAGGGTTAGRSSTAVSDAAAPGAGTPGGTQSSALSPPPDSGNGVLGPSQHKSNHDNYQLTVNDGNPSGSTSASPTNSQPDADAGGSQSSAPSPPPDSGNGAGERRKRKSNNNNNDNGSSSGSTPASPTNSQPGGPQSSAPSPPASPGTESGGPGPLGQNAINLGSTLASSTNSQPSAGAGPAAGGGSDTGGSSSVVSDAQASVEGIAGASGGVALPGSGSGTATVTSHSNADGPPAPAGPLATPGTPFQDTDTGAAAVPAPPGPQPAGRTAGGQADLGTMNGVVAQGNAQQAPAGWDGTTLIAGTTGSAMYGLNGGTGPASLLQSGAGVSWSNVGWGQDYGTLNESVSVGVPYTMYYGSQNWVPQPEQIATDNIPGTSVAPGMPGAGTGFALNLTELPPQAIYIPIPNDTLATGGNPGLVGGSFGAALQPPGGAQSSGRQPMTGQLGILQSLQTAAPSLFVMPTCRYMLPMGATCGGPGTRACSGQQCLPSQLAGGCCVAGSECRTQQGALTCQPSAKPTYSFSTRGQAGNASVGGLGRRLAQSTAANGQPSIGPCNQIGYYQKCGSPGDCCPDGWVCQYNATGASCRPATSTFIPPLVDSLLLDYQSPRAPLGYYPSEVPAAAQRRHLMQAPNVNASTGNSSNAATILSALGKGISQLNLTQYWGVWGGKYCYSAYDPPPPPGMNNTKAPCPVVTHPAVPQIRPVDLPQITQLADGQMYVGVKRPQAIQIKAFTWGGFDDGTTFVSGLWNDSTTLGGDFATIVYRAQLLGFNAVRLPFRFSDLNMQPKNWTFPCTPQRFLDIKNATMSQLGPYASLNSTNIPFPRPTVYPYVSATQSGLCNVYIPNDSTLSRFLWVVQYFVGAGFYVIPSYSPQDHSVDNTVTSTPGIFLRNWANLWSSISDTATFKSSLQNRILLELFSEPDIFGFQWASTNLYNSVIYPSLPDLYGPTMNALIDIDPNVYFLLSGTGQAANYPGMAWGNGFVTDLDAINQYNLSDPMPFFLDLAVAPLLVARTIMSPHVLGPAATGWKHGTNSTALYQMMKQSFAWLSTTGFPTTQPNVTLKFPVIITALGPSLGTAEDQAFMRDFELFANSLDGSSRHTNVTSWAWAGPVGIGGKIDFTSINSLTATPNSADSLKAPAGSLGLLPWYIHPPNMYSNGSNTDVTGNTTATPSVVSAFAVPTASDATPINPGNAAPQADANTTAAGSKITSG